MILGVPLSCVLLLGTCTKRTQQKGFSESPLSCLSFGALGYHSGIEAVSDHPGGEERMLGMNEAILDPLEEHNHKSETKQPYLMPMEWKPGGLT